MNLCDPARSPLVTDDHPTGVLGFRYLLHGTPLTPENYMLQIAENLGHFQMITHRHNFDQFRYVIAGQMNLGEGRILREGELCYFPEGTSYGPQDDPAGPVALVLQFGGASGYGYMSPEQYRRGREQLRQVGRFEGPVYIETGADGRTRKQLSINAIWEQAMGARMLIPAPRYTDVVMMKPRAYRWTPLEGQPGVRRKLLGSFTERGTTAESIQVDARARWRIATAPAHRLLFVLSGGGRAEGRAFGRHFGLSFAPGEAGVVEADDTVELLLFTLPVLSREWLEPQLPSGEPLPGESVPDEALPRLA